MERQARRAPDWERIESDYRAGLLSVREIASANHVSHTAIAKRAKAYGWERDLSAAIKAKAEAKVSRMEVSEEVAKNRLVTDKAIIEANADVIANIRLTHRKDISRARALALKMLGELESQTDNALSYEELAEAIADDDEAGVVRRREIFAKLSTSASRVDSLKKLTETMHRLIVLERDAYGITETQPSPIGLQAQVALDQERFGALARQLTTDI